MTCRQMYIYSSVLGGILPNKVTKVEGDLYCIVYCLPYILVSCFFG